MWPFDKPKQRQQLPPVLYFKSGAAFLEYQCKYGHTEIVENTAIIALVLDARKELGRWSAVLIGEDGSQAALLRVASDDGGFIVSATTPSADGEKLSPDDVVIWVPMRFVSEIANHFSDRREG